MGLAGDLELGGRRSLVRIALESGLDPLRGPGGAQTVFSECPTHSDTGPLGTLM